MFSDGQCRQRLDAVLTAQVMIGQQTPVPLVGRAALQHVEQDEFSLVVALEVEGLDTGREGSIIHGSGSVGRGRPLNGRCGSYGGHSGEDGAFAPDARYTKGGVFLQDEVLAAANAIPG